jgi:hypothetical protein
MHVLRWVAMLIKAYMQVDVDMQVDERIFFYGELLIYMQ